MLLLEAGPPDDAPQIAMPAAFATLFSGPFAWPDATTPQAGAAGRTIGWPHGRALGGSSSINGMVYIRGNPLDFDGWRDDHGCEGWGHADLLPYFRRAEAGPLHVEAPRYTHPLSRAWLASAIAYGLAPNDDFNGAEQDGGARSRSPSTTGTLVRGGRYLRPRRARPNLAVETGAHVTRVVIEGGRATGVRYMRDGAEREARAGEVVLAAGAIRTPQLLSLSGVGPAAELREHGIRAFVDAPGVGRGLQDHPLCLPGWRTPGTSNLWEEATPENMALWERERRGPMCSSGAETGGFARTRDDLPAPDLQIGPLPGPAPDPALALPDRRGVALLAIAIDVRSRGRVGLRSADPADAPVVDPGYLTEAADLDILVAGVRRARAIAVCGPLAELTDGEHAPGDASSGEGGSARA